MCKAEHLKDPLEGEVMRQGHAESEFVRLKKRDLPYETMDDEGGEDAKVTRGVKPKCVDLEIFTDESLSAKTLLG